MVALMNSRELSTDKTPLELRLFCLALEARSQNFSWFVCFRNLAAYWQSMPLSYAPKLDFVNFTVFNPNPVKKLSDGVGQLWGNKPHQDVFFTAILQLVRIFGKLSGIPIFRRNSFQLHEDTCLESVLK
jgi:hypothetical protein